jgi:Tfp pilus assembly PilM family ATPase
MTRYLALEWDAREVRAAVANLRGSDMVVEDAFALPLTPSEPGETFADPQVGKMVADALNERGSPCSETLVAVGRASIELRLLSLPPAPPEEVPDMVRFQAMQSFTAIGEDWPLDYVELEETEEAHKVLAAAISPKLVSQISNTCDSGSLTPRRLVLRPFAAASLLDRNGPSLEGRATLMVDVLADEADLTVMEGDKVVFMRTVRLPSTDDVEVQSRALVGEIRRTIGAAANQLHGRRVDQFVVCGAANGHQELKTALGNSLSVEVASFDPFEGVRLSKSLRDRLPENPGRFAPLLGMLADEVAGARHAVDFLHPRKRPAPPSQKRRYLLIGATVAAAVLAIVGTIWGRLHSLDNQIAELRIESAALNDVVERANGIIGKVNAIDEFQDGDITWLDELREAASHLPNADDTILDELSFGAAVGGGGTMLLKGHVRDSSLIEVFEDSLRYQGNDVSGKHGAVDSKRPEYPFLLEATVFVEPDKRDEGRSLGRPYRDEIRELSNRDMQPGDAVGEDEAIEQDQSVTSADSEDTAGSQSS